MALVLYMHPLSSYCQKALIALYENETPFEAKVVNLGDEAERDAFKKVWPLAKFPVLRDHARGFTVPESTAVIEYLDVHHRGRTRFIPADPDMAWQTRMRDRFFDFYVNDPMGRIVGDRIRPADKRDPYGVEQAKGLLRTAYAVIDEEMKSRTWAMGDAFSMADCAAAPALFYADKVLPFGEHANVTAYFARLLARPSYARAIAEAEPYFALFPK